MRRIILFVSCILLVLFAVERSGVLRFVPYTAKEGGIQVEKTRLEWHPEKFTLFVKDISKKIPQKWTSRFFKKEIKEETVPLLPETQAPEARQKEKDVAYRLVLKNGAMLHGKVAQRSEEGILFETEGIRVFFHHGEIASLETE